MNARMASEEYKGQAVDRSSPPAILRSAVSGLVVNFRRLRYNHLSFHHNFTDLGQLLAPHPRPVLRFDSKPFHLWEG